MGRTTLPPEVADALAYLRSAQSSFIACWTNRRHQFDLESPHQLFSGFHTHGGRLQHKRFTFTLVLQCQLCGTLRREVRLTRMGERILGPYYEHPDGYSRAGSGIDWRSTSSDVFYAHLFTRWSGQEPAAPADNVRPFRPRRPVQVGNTAGGAAR